MRSVAMRRGLAAAVGVAALAAFAGPALADEMWQTNWGTMEYTDEIGSAAVFSYENGALYIDGLAGNFTKRGSHSGMWMDYSGNVQCDQPALDDYGDESWSWGYLAVYFIDSGYPSRWSADYTVCDGPVAGTITAKPL